MSTVQPPCTWMIPPGRRDGEGQRQRQEFGRLVEDAVHSHRCAIPEDGRGAAAQPGQLPAHQRRGGSLTSRVSFPALACCRAEKASTNPTCPHAGVRVGLSQLSRCTWLRSSFTQLPLGVRITMRAQHGPMQGHYHLPQVHPPLKSLEAPNCGGPKYETQAAVFAGCKA